jgi:hypothetical protein
MPQNEDVPCLVWLYRYVRPKWRRSSVKGIILSNKAGDHNGATDRCCIHASIRDIETLTPLLIRHLLPVTDRPHDIILYSRHGIIHPALAPDELSDPLGFLNHQCRCSGLDQAVGNFVRAERGDFESHFEFRHSIRPTELALLVVWGGKTNQKN